MQKEDGGFPALFFSYWQRMGSNEFDNCFKYVQN